VLVPLIVIPPHLGPPSIHSGMWESFIQACKNADTVIRMHVGSSSKMPAISPDAPTGAQVTLGLGE